MVLGGRGKGGRLAEMCGGAAVGESRGASESLQRTEALRIPWETSEDYVGAHLVREREMSILLVK